MAIIDPTRHHKAVVPPPSKPPPVAPVAATPKPKSKPKPKPKPATVDKLKAEYDAELDAYAGGANVREWFDGAFDKDAVEATLMRAALFRAREAGAKKLQVHGRQKPGGSYSLDKRVIDGDWNASKFSAEKAGIFRHEFGHYLDITGAKLAPRSKKQMRHVFASSRAARELKRDHDNLPTARANAVSAEDTAADLYKKVGVGLDRFDGDFYEYHLGDHMLKKHGGDKAKALAAVKQVEKQIAKHLKSKGIDFDYEKMLGVVDTAQPLGRGAAAVRLAVELLRGDRTRGISAVLSEAMESTGNLKDFAKLQKLHMLYDFIGALTNNRYGGGHTRDYYKRGGTVLFKTEVGVIHERNLSEGFAEYFEMRYDQTEFGKFRLEIARSLFPATTNRYDKLIEEIGDGKYPLSDIDHAAESKLTTKRKRGAK